jgi:hypothetical protein
MVALMTIRPSLPPATFDAVELRVDELFGADPEDDD